MVQLKGNGKIVSKSFPVSSFLRLHVGVKGVTELIQSDDERVEVEIDENLVDQFEVGNHGSTLYISTDGKIRSAIFTKVLVRVYIRQLDHLVIRCDGGDVITPQPLKLKTPLDLKIQSRGNTQLNIEAPELKASLQATGDCTLSGRCALVEIKTQSQGNLFAKELIASELKLKNASMGNVEVYAEDKIWITHHGHGSVHYFGNAQLMDVRQFGHGELRHG